MAFSDYQQTYAWQSALELGPKLTRLAEELPAGEQNGLTQALLNLAIDLPTAVGLDIQNGSTTRNEILVRLQSVLELTARIYPALDNVMVENALAERIERFTGANFTETIPAPAPPVAREPEVEVSAPVETAAPSEPTPNAEDIISTSIIAPVAPIIPVAPVTPTPEEATPSQ